MSFISCGADCCVTSQLRLYKEELMRSYQTSSHAQPEKTRTNNTTNNIFQVHPITFSLSHVENNHTCHHEEIYRSDSSSTVARHISDFALVAVCQSLFQRRQHHVNAGLRAVTSHESHPQHLKENQTTSERRLTGLTGVDASRGA